MTQLEIQQRATGHGLEIRDRIERVEVVLETSDTVEPTPADTGIFVYPVDEAVSFTTESLGIDAGTDARILDTDGNLVATSMQGNVSVEPGTYYISLFDRVKTYLYVEASNGIDITLDTDTGTNRVDFGDEQRVTMGVRSLHERPATAITTTEEPADLMRAVSMLGSAMKTTTSMRSYGTLRGHPPDIELGDELHVPSELDRPDTGVRIELPHDPALIYASAPLAYYLVADIVPGDEPRLVTESGFEHSLETHRGVEGELERVLKQVFLLDCLVRSNGAYSQRLAERDELEPVLDIDLDALYDAPTAEQVEAYLSVPYETVEEYVPTWSVSAHVEPTPDSAELLPYLVNELAMVRSPRSEETTTITAPAGGESQDFTRSAAASSAPATGPGTAAPDQANVGPSVGPQEREVVVPETHDAHRQVWAADGIPVGAAKPLKEGYRNRFDRDPVEESLEIVVVCNDPSMAAEDSAVRDLLSAPTGLDIRIRPYRELHTHELQAVLERGADFFHFIGHVNDGGLECPDGYLDVHSLETVGVDSFFLNACDSYEQGRALVRKGAITGVVTLTDVLNSTAVDVGRELAQLLNYGIPVSNALGIAQSANPCSDRYTVIGDGSLQVAQDTGGGPLFASLERTDDGYLLDYDVYTTTQWPAGSEYRLWLESASEVVLFGGCDDIRVTRDDILELFEIGNVPLEFEGELRWSDDIDPEEL